MQATAVAVSQQQITYQQSLAIVKQLVHTAIGCFTFIRCLLPEDNFTDTSIGSERSRLRTKQIKRGYSAEGDLLLDYIERGMFDAIEKKYLRKAILAVYQEVDKIQKVIESYTIHFIYEDGTTKLHVQNSKGQIAMHSDPNVNKLACNLMRSLIMMTQTLAPLPDDKCITIKLFYYEDITPTDYQPPLFRDATTDDPLAFYTGDENNSPQKTPLGGIDTRHHTVSLALETLPEDVGPSSKKPRLEQNHAWNAEQDDQGDIQMADEIMCSQEVAIDMFSNSTQRPSVDSAPIRSNKQIQSASSSQDCAYSSDPEDIAISDMQSTLPLNSQLTQTLDESIHAQSLMRNLSLNGASKPSLNSSLTHVSDSQTQNAPEMELRKETRTDINLADGDAGGESTKADQVKCECGDNVLDGDMIQCHKCKYWCHLPCYGYNGRRDRRIPTDHVCYPCRFDNDASRLEAMRALAIWRRALRVVWDEEPDNDVKDFANRLGCNVGTAQTLFDRLCKEGFVVQPRAIARSGRKRGKTWTTSKSNDNKRKFSAYFDPEMNLCTDAAAPNLKRKRCSIAVEPISFA